MNPAQESYRKLSAELDLPPFYRPEYLDLCYGRDNWLGLATSEPNQPIALWPVGIIKKWGFNRALQHFFTPRSGIWTPGQAKLAAGQMEQLLGQLPDHSHFHQSFPVGFSGKNELVLAGFHAEKRLTYRLDLTIGEERLWNNMRADYRNNKIRKAEGLFTLKTGIAPGDFYRIHHLTYARQNMPIYYSPAFLKEWDQLIRKHQWGETFAAVDANGHHCSVAALLYGEGTAWLLMAGDDPQFRKGGSGVWLMWQLMRLSAEQGYKSFDFLGSMVPAIARVRRQLGGVGVPYWSISRTSGVVYPAARMVFSLFNRG